MTGSFFVIYSLVFLVIFVVLYSLVGRYIDLDRLKQLSLFRIYWSRDKTVYTLVVFITVVLLVSNYFLDLPIKTLFILTILNLIVKENYPFSHYPMYATFSQYSNFVFITDEEDKPIPTSKVFGVKSNFIKKIYMSEVKKISLKKNMEPWELSVSDLNKPGELTLDYLIANADSSYIAKHFKSLKLYDTTICLKDRQIQKNRRLVSEKTIK